MNTIAINSLKALRKLYQRVYKTHPYLECDRDFDSVSDTVLNYLTSERPCMICRFGSGELSTVVNYLGVINPNPSIWNYIKYKEPAWWWNNGIIEKMQSNAGLFPASAELCARFSQLMLEDMKQVDILGSWLQDEAFIIDRLPNAKLVRLLCLEPFFAKNPWTLALEGKKVIVVHPFSKEIEEQYSRKEHLFNGRTIMPDFKLRTVKAVQSIGGECEGFADWFEALDWMKSEIDKEDYDIAIIGCGAYGFPLAAHCKRKGRKAIHLGGVTQLLFGIRGRRWEDPFVCIAQGLPANAYTDLMNEYWIRPNESSRPKTAQQVEGACYW